PESEVPVINVESADSQFASAYLSFTSPDLEQVFAIVREAAAAYGSDHYFAPDIARATDGVRAGRYRAFAGDLLPSV
ncbi:MAG: hypothetical protein RDU12_11650, partial [Brevundimonas sp.]|nr:hypothetical protein [Brevundimonas sp.]